MPHLASPPIIVQPAPTRLPTIGIGAGVVPTYPPYPPYPPEPVLRSSPAIPVLVPSPVIPPSLVSQPSFTYSLGAPAEAPYRLQPQAGLPAPFPRPSSRGSRHSTHEIYPRARSATPTGSAGLQPQFQPDEYQYRRQRSHSSGQIDPPKIPRYLSAPEAYPRSRSSPKEPALDTVDERTRHDYYDDAHNHASKPDKEGNRRHRPTSAEPGYPGQGRYHGHTHLHPSSAYAPQDAVGHGHEHEHEHQHGQRRHRAHSIQ